MGIRQPNIDPNSHLAKTQNVFSEPIAADTNYIVESVDLNAAAAGDALTLATAALAGKPLQHPRGLTITSVDASGTNLSVTVKVTGSRFGKTISELITATGAGGGETVASTYVYDAVTAVSITALANKAASDTLVVGVDGKRLGLSAQIRSVKDVFRLFKTAAGTPTATGCVALATLQTTAVVSVVNSSLDMFAAFGSTSLAVTDRYEVDFYPAGPDVILRRGYRS